MKTTEEMILFVEADPDKESNMKFFLVNLKHEWYTNDEQVKLCRIQITYDIPADLNEDQIRRKAIQMFKDKQDRVIAEAQVAKNRLQEKIDQLLMLTNQSEPIIQLVNNGNDIPF